MMEPHDIFRRCGHDLFGEGNHWKSQMAQFLEVKTDTVDAMAKGKSRVPPGIWADLFNEVARRKSALGQLAIIVANQIPMGT